MCYCASVPSIETRTRVVILQHPRERDMPIGTARMASLALPNSRLHVGARWSEHAELRASLADPARPPVLLYPGNDAKDILVEPPDHPVTLVVVDGTWSQAKTIVRDNPILQTLPRYAFAAPELSRYRIRKEPRAEYCSTIEALMHVLGVLEGDREKFRALLVPFERMIDAQLAAQDTAPKRAMRQIIRGKHSPVIPTIVTDTLARWDDLVCIVAEANAWPYVAGEPHRPDELIHLLAYRVATNALFDTLVAPRSEISPSTAFHLALPIDELRNGISVDDARAAFASFLRPTDLAIAWGSFGPDLLARAEIPLPPHVDLRDAARRKVNRVTPQLRVGTLETYAGSIELPHAPAGSIGATGVTLGRGRGGARVGMLVDILRAWRR